MTTTLVPIDGSQASLEAARYAVRSRPHDDLLLLYVAPSGRPVDMERGRFLLDQLSKVCEELGRGGGRVTTRLEVGDRRAKLSQVAAEANCGMVVMSAQGKSSLPHVDRVDPQAADLSDGLRRPVVLVLPTGQGIRTGPAEEEAAEEPDAVGVR
jgi:nucleotide-binding universal stress UspA family protein